MDHSSDHGMGKRVGQVAQGARREGWMTRARRKSVLAIAVGILAIIVVTTGVDIALHFAGVFPPLNVPIDNKLSLIALSYRIVISIAGAWLTARLAPARPMKHALMLGLVGTVLGALGEITTIGKG